MDSKRSILLLIAIAFLSTTSCKKETPVDVLSPGEIASVLAESMLNTVSEKKTTQTDSVYTLQAVLDKRAIDLQKFNRSVSHYRGQNSVWLKILEETATILDEEKNKPAQADSTKNKK